MSGSMTPAEKAYTDALARFAGQTAASGVHMSQLYTPLESLSKVPDDHVTTFLKELDTGRLCNQAISGLSALKANADSYEEVTKGFFLNTNQKIFAATAHQHSLFQKGQELRDEATARLNGAISASVTRPQAQNAEIEKFLASLRS